VTFSSAQRSNYALGLLSVVVNAKSSGTGRTDVRLYTENRSNHAVLLDVWRHVTSHPPTSQAYRHRVRTPYPVPLQAWRHSRTSSKHV